jgi:hypothetical protein
MYRPRNMKQFAQGDKARKRHEFDLFRHQSQTGENTGSQNKPQSRNVS